MKNQTIEFAESKQKTIIINALYAGTLSIVFLGIFFGAFSVRNNISFQVLNTSIPGIVIGLLVAYLGLKYYFMVSKFKITFFESHEKFSWSNFKKEKRKLMKHKK